MRRARRQARGVSVLFNEPKLLKSEEQHNQRAQLQRFSALQRAEIAEMLQHQSVEGYIIRFSALQRAEIAEILVST